MPATLKSKVCSKCGEEKDVSAFYKHKTTADGYRPECKECHQRRRRKYYEENKEAILKKQKEYAEAHAEEIAEYKRQWRKENKERLRKKKRAYYEANKEKIKAYVARWRRENNKGTEYWNKRHAQKQGAEICDFTEEDWEELLEHNGAECANCGSEENLTRDHVVPLSRGGNHTLTNIMPLCHSCNASKGTKTALEFLLAEAVG